MINSSDENTFEDGKKELGNIFKMPEIKGVPILVYANFQDAETAVEPEEIEDKFGLDDVKNGKIGRASCRERV